MRNRVSFFHAFGNYGLAGEHVGNQEVGTFRHFGHAV